MDNPNRYKESLSEDKSKLYEQSYNLNQQQQALTQIINNNQYLYPIEYENLPKNSMRTSDIYPQQQQQQLQQQQQPQQQQQQQHDKNLIQNNGGILPMMNGPNSLQNFEMFQNMMKMYNAKRYSMPAQPLNNMDNMQMNHMYMTNPMNYMPDISSTIPTTIPRFDTLPPNNSIHNNNSSGIRPNFPSLIQPPPNLITQRYQGQSQIDDVLKVNINNLVNFYALLANQKDMFIPNTSLSTMENSLYPSSSGGGGVGVGGSSSILSTLVDSNNPKILTESKYNKSSSGEGRRFSTEETNTSIIIPPKSMVTSLIDNTEMNYTKKQELLNQNTTNNANNTMKKTLSSKKMNLDTTMQNLSTYEDEEFNHSFSISNNPHHYKRFDTRESDFASLKKSLNYDETSSLRKSDNFTDERPLQPLCFKPPNSERNIHIEDNSNNNGISSHNNHNNSTSINKASISNITTMTQQTNEKISERKHIFDDIPLTGKATKKFEEILEEQLQKEPDIALLDNTTNNNNENGDNNGDGYIKTPYKLTEQKRDFLKKRTRQYLSSSQHKIHKKDMKNSNNNRDYRDSRTSNRRSLIFNNYNADSPNDMHIPINYSTINSSLSTTKKTIPSARSLMIDKNKQQQTDQDQYPPNQNRKILKNFLQKGNGKGGGKGVGISSNSNHIHGVSPNSKIQRFSSSKGNGGGGFSDYASENIFTEGDNIAYNTMTSDINKRHYTSEIIKEQSSENLSHRISHKPHEYSSTKKQYSPTRGHNNASKLGNNTNTSNNTAYTSNNTAYTKKFFQRLHDYTTNTIDDEGDTLPYNKDLYELGYLQQLNEKSKRSYSDGNLLLINYLKEKFDTEYTKEDDNENDGDHDGNDGINGNGNNEELQGKSKGKKGKTQMENNSPRNKNEYGWLNDPSKLLKALMRKRYFNDYRDMKSHFSNKTHTDGDSTSKHITNGGDNSSKHNTNEINEAISPEKDGKTHYYLKEKMNYLNTELAKVKLENEMIAKKKQKHDELVKMFNKEKIDWIKQKDKEIKEFQEWKQEEMNKLRREKKNTEKQNKAMQNGGGGNRGKESEENENLRKQLVKALEDSRIKDKKYQQYIDKLKKQVDDQSNKIKELQRELNWYEELRIQGKILIDTSTPIKKDNTKTNIGHSIISSDKHKPHENATPISDIANQNIKNDQTPIEESNGVENLNDKESLITTTTATGNAAASAIHDKNKDNTTTPNQYAMSPNQCMTTPSQYMTSPSQQQYMTSPSQQQYMTSPGQQHMTSPGQQHTNKTKPQPFRITKGACKTSDRKKELPQSNRNINTSKTSHKAGSKTNEPSDFKTELTAKITPKTKSNPLNDGQTNEKSKILLSSTQKTDNKAKADQPKSENKSMSNTTNLNPNAILNANPNTNSNTNPNTNSDTSNPTFRVFDWKDYKYDTNVYYMEYIKAKDQIQKIVKQTTDKDGRIDRLYQNGKKELIFQNGVKKEILANGYAIVHFNNGDIKQTLPDNTVIYYYAEAQTTQTTLTNGENIYRFSNNQIEFHGLDAVKEIYFSDGARKVIDNKGQEETIFKDGTIQRIDANKIKTIEYSNGQKDIGYPDGTKIRMYPDGKCKKIYADGHIEEN